MYYNTGAEPILKPSRSRVDEAKIKAILETAHVVSYRSERAFTAMFFNFASVFALFATFTTGWFKDAVKTGKAHFPAQFPFSCLVPEAGGF